MALGRRLAFQRKWAREARGRVLNIGCNDDPCGLGEKGHPQGLNLNVIHFDLDWWKHPQFVRGDAHDLSLFADKAFSVVVMGDIHEHLIAPRKATAEAARVARDYLVMTIFEEWRLPSLGQHIAEALDKDDRIAKERGFENHQAMVWHDSGKTGRAAVDNRELPHLTHINQFSEEDIELIVQAAVDQGMVVREFLKAEEATHEGHTWSNWLICLGRD